MASVSEILSRLNLSSRDLNNISLSQLKTIFRDLTVKEIATLCTVSKRFNTLCKNESFWRNKVFDDYGIEKKYGDTWRQTAINMDKVDMINLGAKWIDGRTYMEILDDALKNGADVITDLQLEYLRSWFDNKRDSEYMLSRLDDEKQIQSFSEIYEDTFQTDDGTHSIFLIKSSEIDVIYATVLTYKGKGLYLPGDTITDTTTGDSLLSYDFLRKMIDPIIYVMQFSSFSPERLAKVSH